MEGARSPIFWRINLYIKWEFFFIFRSECQDQVPWPNISYRPLGCYLVQWSWRGRPGPPASRSSHLFPTPNSQPTNRPTDQLLTSSFLLPTFRNISFTPLIYFVKDIKFDFIEILEEDCLKCKFLNVS